MARPISKRLLGRREGGDGQERERFLASHLALVGLIVLVIATSIASPAFLEVGNLLNVLRQTSINGVMAMGMTFVILTAGIDLSVGAVLAFYGAVAAV